MTERRFADLHNHTTASDGLFTPEELIGYAKENGVYAVGVTDHDSINGIEPAIAAANKLGMEVVPGIEISTRYNYEDVHILGYYIEEDNDEFNNTIKKIRDARYSRAEGMLRKLKQLYGFSITLDEVLAESGRATITRPHIGRVMIKKNYINDLNEAFRDYIGFDCPAYVDRYKIDPDEGIRLILKAGGVPILAHPGLLKRKETVFDLIKDGIMGIEAYHSKHTNWQNREYAQIANDYHLICTAGSDCHGDRSYSNKPIVGTVRTDYDTVEKLKKTAKYIKQNCII